MTNTIIEKTLDELINEANAKENVIYTEKTIPTNILNKLEKENSEKFINQCKYLASLDNDLFVANFFTVSIEKNLSEKETEKAIKESVSVTIKVIEITESGLLCIKEKAKPISFNDILNAKIALLATSHADNKPTKEDKANALKHFFGEYGIGYCNLFTHSARKFTSIGNVDDTKENIKVNADYVKAFDIIEKICQDSKKENPFKKDSNNGYTEQIQMVYNYFIKNSSVKFNAYHAKALFQMICNRNKYGKLTISSVNDVMNTLAIVYRYAYNGYKLPTNDKSNIYKVSKN